ncbi:MAG: inositol monophosphatase family protein [bacterium]
MAHLPEFIGDMLDLASGELLRRFGSVKDIKTKKDTSIVTDADLASEKIILDRITKFFPDDAIISEESGQMKVNRAAGQKVWIVDPLDGTTNFANSFPFFSVSIGYGEFLADGRIRILAGGIADPIHKNKYLAERGSGAICNGSPMQVVKDRAFSQCFLVTGFYYTVGKDLDREIERYRRVAQQCQSIRRDGSAALDLALVAAGVYDGFWERGLALWDVAAGSLLVSEARGIVTNYPSPNTAAEVASLGNTAAGLSYNLEGEGIIAGTPTVVSQISHLLAT